MLNFQRASVKKVRPNCSATVAGVSMGLAQTLLYSRAWRIEERNVLDIPSGFM